MRTLVACLVLLALLATATPSAGSDTPAFATSPAWSPDGKSIAFIGDSGPAGGNTALWVMNSDGTNVRQLTDEHYAFDPTWSPDSKRIAFSFTSSFAIGISVVNANGTGLHEIVHNGGGPAWSPGGRRIAFSFGPVDQPLRIYAVSPDGSNHSVVAAHSEQFDCSVTSPTWSPDGQRIAFYDECLGGIGAVKKFGGRVAVLSRNTRGSGLDWSPGGRRLAYTSGNALWVLDLKTGRKTSLHSGSSPSWSPNSRRVVFSDRGAIYAMSADGTEVSKLYPR